MNFLTSKAIWGVILAVVGWLFSPDVLATMNGTVSVLMQAVGTVLTVVGLRHASAKAAKGVVQ